MTDKPGLIVVQSAHDVENTVARFRAAIEAAGQMIFAEMDHAKGAADVGLNLRPTRLLLFGHPRGGTPLMQLDQTVGIDLPLKALIWQDAQGQTWLAYNDARWVADRHGLGGAADKPVQVIAAGMTKLVAAATR